MSDEVNDLRQRLVRLEGQVKWLSRGAWGLVVGLLLVLMWHDKLSRDVEDNERAVVETRRLLGETIEVLRQDLPQK